MLLLLAIPYFIFLIVIESLLDKYYNINNYQWPDAISSVFMGLVSLFINTIPHLITYPLFQHLYHYRVIDIEPNTLSYFILIVLYDFSFYWSHRISHRCRLMWASHVVHHSSEKYILTTALRQSWTDAIFNTLFYLYIPLLGFPLHMIITVRAINLVYQFWIHTEFKIELGVLEYVFNTPAHHSIHHASNQEYLGKKIFTPRFVSRS
jgi:sterol desaturase/sphingolipid hydroxylase (fatty acid hydroxylase superfamily)